MAHILIVDDELAIRELFYDILSDEGHRVDLAQDAGQARAAQRRMQPDLVLLDISLPGTDGLALLKEWSGLGLLAGMSVVMMRGHDCAAWAAQARRLGARGLLAKPIALNALLKAVEQGLSRIAALPQDGPEGALPASAQAQDAPGACRIFLAQTLQAARAEIERADFRFHLQDQRSSMRQLAKKKRHGPLQCEPKAQAAWALQ